MINISSEQIYQLEKQYRISLINSLVGYKSLNLLGTASNEGITNLCIISSAFHLGANPPLLGIVIRPEREQNSTLTNIKSTGHYTLNNVLPEWYMQAHQTSAYYPSDVSEFDTCGFQKLYTNHFKAPFVKQSTIRIGLELREIIDLEINGTTILIGEIVHILANDDMIAADGTVDHVKAKTMSVAGLDAYFLPQAVGRLAYAKPGIEPHELNKSY
ncbi:flavin reductase (DIM6/NTAB) family NADH-FMN oxidoreductase RutF [Pedobacter cryoconitis]|uniref:Flavin reductase (DIM6/NTAB) family NADH-FMN oxidoreductase RutF n=1 Tax=Pedobacter cryoconitis TaxID=188932 RepID=A0A7W9DXD3_9SPHI|nr:flavin reductase family protein [Pedobacter cryoconitis]MBB5635002.1 flavin reductase (DIM6/NTAB) family NADH-FMN oxidoreductase RutF [Pedobacter cryoconitis]MBB6271814.1 flavin reductase (DIM6/NTAB) family NADH-FMN oxidoreductase RutF [Pedobacter cryoconitis]